jgi:nucleotide-binding universal stress UspA family protein
MAIYKKILIAFDGSEAGKRAAERGIELAVDQKAEVIGVKVIDFTGELVAPSDTLWARIRDDIHEKAEAILSELVSMAKQREVVLTPIIREGGTEHELITQAKESGADIIVMGTAGRSARTQVGKNVRRMLIDAPCPVMLVN